MKEESQLQRAVVAHLEAHGAPGLIYLHINNNPRSARDGARLKKMGLRKGAPDLLYFVRGSFFAHELKTKKGRLSPAQSVFLKEFNLAGGVPIVSYGLNDALRLLSEYGICRGKIQ
jgi:hypothetical protein